MLLPAYRGSRGAAGGSTPAGRPPRGYAGRLGGPSEASLTCVHRRGHLPGRRRRRRPRCSWRPIAPATWPSAPGGTGLATAAEGLGSPGEFVLQAPTPVDRRPGRRLLTAAPGFGSASDPRGERRPRTAHLPRTVEPPRCKRRPRPRSAHRGDRAGGPPGRRPDVAERKNRAISRSLASPGGAPVPARRARARRAERAAAFATMDGLLLSGGADLDPRSVRPAEPRRSRDVEPDRDALEAARPGQPRGRKGVPVLGICRGFQALNVFLGGSLLQDVDGHARRPVRLRARPDVTRFASAAGYPSRSHPLPDRTPSGGVVSGQQRTTTRRSARPTSRRASSLPGVARARPASSSRRSRPPTATPSSSGCSAIPSEPSRRPPAFDRLWRFFVDAAADRPGAAGANGGGRPEGPR